MTTARKTGRKPSAGPYKLLVGRRMRLAAEQSGYQTCTAMGEALGVPPSTISRYWNGKQNPSADELARYGEIVGRPAWWFYLDANDDQFSLVGEALLGIVERVMRGEDLAVSHSQVTGDPAQFGARERAELAAGTPAVRTAITRAAGGDWEGQTPRRRRQVVAALAAEALRDRGE